MLPYTPYYSLTGDLSDLTLPQLVPDRVPRKFHENSPGRGCGRIECPVTLRRNRISEIYYPAGLREYWLRSNRLARIWRTTYPQIFDDDDLRLATRQPHYHFVEWIAAIHLFTATNLYSLMGKYAFKNHARKRRIALGLMGKRKLDLLRDLQGQPPDLFVYRPATSEFWFVEVKGPHDRARAVQQQDQKRISALFHCPVDEIRVREVES